MLIYVLNDIRTMFSSPSENLLSIGIPKEIAYNALRLSVGRETCLSDIDVVVNDLQHVLEKLQSD